MLIGQNLGVLIDKSLGQFERNGRLIGLTSAFGFLAIMLVFRILLVFSYSPDISVGEDNNVWNIQKMLQNIPLYTNPEKPPFEIFVYTPLSQYPVFWIADVFKTLILNGQKIVEV